MDLREPDDDISEWEDVGMMEGVLSGKHPLDISHHGGEFEDLCEHIIKMYARFGESNDWNLALTVHPFSRGPRLDHRTRRDRTERCQQAFEKQIKAIATTFMAWNFNNIHQHSAATPISSNIAGQYSVCIIDIFSKLFIQLIIYINLTHTDQPLPTPLSIFSRLTSSLHAALCGKVLCRQHLLYPR